MPVKAKHIKDLPLKNEFDGSESLLVQDSNGTKQAPLEVIVDEIKQNSQEKIREIESELFELENNVTYKKISEFGAISENLWFDVETKRYYADKNFTIQPHDNTEAFRLAVNSGFNIIIDNDYYVSDTIKIEKPIYLIGNGCYKIYTNPSPTRKSVLEVYNRCHIDSLVFESESVYPNWFYELNGFSWNVANGYSSNLDAISLYCDDNTITKTKVINYLSMCMTEKNPNNNYNNIKNIKIDNCVLENIYIGIGVGSCDDIIIENSTFITEPTTLTDTMGHSIYLYGGVDNCIINNCKFYINASTNTVIKLMDNLESRGVTNVVRISNCYFEYIGTESANIVYPLLLHGCSNVDCDFINCEMINTSVILDAIAGKSGGVVHLKNCKMYSNKDVLSGSLIVNNNSSAVKVYLENSFFDIRFIKENESYVEVNYDISNCTFKINYVWFKFEKDYIIQQCKIEAGKRFRIGGGGKAYILNSVIDTNKINENYKLNYCEEQCIIIGSLLKGVRDDTGDLECIGCKIISY